MILIVLLFFHHTDRNYHNFDTIIETEVETLMIKKQIKGTTL